MPIQRFTKILIANRGEIAVRIIRACRELQILAVAVYSTADSDSLHVEMADEAVCIGEAPAADSYLNIERIIAVAHQLGAQAIHPGYGFLAENPALAAACELNQLVFIGPSAASMGAIASKQAARQLVASLSVPVIPGAAQLVSYGAELIAYCERITYPILLKAAAGGGGMGMRVVTCAAELEAAFQAVSSEARQAFGDDGIIVEQYLSAARHIEVQVLADSHGNCLHLHERDCSLQRRRQKIIEESPARGLPAAVKQDLCAAAVRIAEHIGYCGAGTVEFLYSPGEQRFYFLEMNTRLQVEHGVTEAVTGIDIVQWQIRIAEGEAISLQQSGVVQRGHAIECRICAESPQRDFIPATGRIALWRPPSAQRCDSGIRSGDTVAVHYDSLLAKLIAHGDDFDDANRKLQYALNQTALLGVDSNLQFLKNLLASAPWRSGGLDTGAVALHHASWAAAPAGDNCNKLIAAVLAAENHRRGESDWPGRGHIPRIWHIRLEQGCEQRAEQRAERSAEQDRVLELVTRSQSSAQQTLVIGDGVLHSKIYSLQYLEQPSVLSLDIEIDCHRFTAVCQLEDQRAAIHSDTLGSLRLQLGSSGTQAAQGAATDTVSSPMPAKVAAISIAVGDVVEKNQQLLVLESMKMESAVTASRAGRVAAIHVQVGELVSQDAVLLTFESED